MLIDQQINRPSPSLENGNSWSHLGRLQTKPSRRIQTDLTDQELAQNNLMVVHGTQSVKILKHLLNADSDWNSGDPILIQVSNFEGLAKESEPEIAFEHPEVEASWWGQFESRLADLHDAAIEEEIPLSEASLTAASQFAKSLHAIRAPSTFLVGNGNIRLFWSNEDGEQVGLQFRDKKRVQYVFFKMAEGQLEQMMGTKLASGILDLIGVLGMRHVISI